jgi:hypothetical protein
MGDFCNFYTKIRTRKHAENRGEIFLESPNRRLYIVSADVKENCSMNITGR